MRSFSTLYKIVLAPNINTWQSAAQNLCDFIWSWKYCEKKTVRVCTMRNRFYYYLPKIYSAWHNSALEVPGHRSAAINRRLAHKNFNKIAIANWNTPCAIEEHKRKQVHKQPGAVYSKAEQNVTKWFINCIMWFIWKPVKIRGIKLCRIYFWYHIYTIYLQKYLDYIYL